MLIYTTKCLLINNEKHPLINTKKLYLFNILVLKIHIFFVLINGWKHYVN